MATMTLTKVSKDSDFVNVGKVQVTGIDNMVAEVGY